MSNHNKETEARCLFCYRHYVEGTAAWALYMMRMGHKITNPMYDPRIYHLPEGGMIHVNGIESIATTQWIDYWCIDIPDGWKIYEEPKPQPQYKVGDWVEYTISGNTFSSKVYGLPYNNIAVVASRKMGLPSVENILTEQITRKLDPSEVIVKIGCLEGTVRCYDKFAFWLIGKDGARSVISFAMLDPETADLVKALLKAQEGAE